MTHQDLIKGRLRRFPAKQFVKVAFHFFEGFETTSTLFRNISGR
jgi:hypothetical protein